MEMKRIAEMAGLLLLVGLLAALPACDNNSSGGGTATAKGYNLADLAGVWAMKYSGWGGGWTVAIDAEGNMRVYADPYCSPTRGNIRFKVFPDGRISGKGWITCFGWSSFHSFWNGVFK